MSKMPAKIYANLGPLPLWGKTKLIETEVAYIRADIVEKMVEALEWYGEQSRLARLIHSGGDEGRKSIAGDGGLKSRTALALYRAAIQQQEGRA